MHRLELVRDGNLEGLQENLNSGNSFGVAEFGRPYFIRSESPYEFSHKTTMLHLACQQGHTEMVQWMVDTMVEGSKGGKEFAIRMLQQTDDDGAMPIHAAAFAGNADIVRYLLNSNDKLQPESDLFQATSDGSTVFLLAASRGALQILKICWPSSETAGTGGTLDVNKGMNNEGKTALHLAAAGGHLDAVIWLIQQCHADVKVADGASSETTPVFLEACTSGHLHVCKWLVENIPPEDLNIHAVDRKSALHYACLFSDNVELVQWLVEEQGFGIHDGRADGGYQPLHCACLTNRLTIVQWLLESGGAKIDSTTGSLTNYTAIYIAVYKRHVDLARYLIQKAGAPFVDVKDADGKTPQDVATETEVPELMDLFCKKAKLLQLLPVATIQSS